MLSSQERWLLLPQAPVADSKVLDHPNESPTRDMQPGSQLVDRALLIRLATKEDILDEGPAASLGSTEDDEYSVERAAACARLVWKFQRETAMQYVIGIDDAVFSSIV